MSENISSDTCDWLLAKTFQEIIGGTNVEMNRLRSYELNILSEVLLTVREKAENNEPLTLREVELLEKHHKRIYASLDKLKTILADSETFAYDYFAKLKRKEKEFKNKENA